MGVSINLLDTPFFYGTKCSFYPSAASNINEIV